MGEGSCHTPDGTSCSRTGWISPLARLILLIGAYVPAFLADRYIDEEPRKAVVLLGAGFAAVFAASLWRRERRKFEFPPRDPHMKTRVWFLIPALVLAGFAFYAGLRPKISWKEQTYLWLFSVGFAVLPFWIYPCRKLRREKGEGNEESTEQEPPEPRKRGKTILAMEIAAFVSLLFVALGYRLPYLERFPVKIHNDESSCALMSEQIGQEWKKGEVKWFSTRSFYNYPTLGFAPDALSMALVSPNLYAHRLTNVVLAMAALACLYLVLRGTLGTAAGLLGLGLAATGHVAVHWSRSGIHHGHAAFLAAICAFLLWKSIDTGRLRWFVLLGCFLAMCTLTYQGAFIVPLWLGIVILYMLVFSFRFLKRYIVSFVVAFLVSVIFLAPMGAWYEQEPEQFMSRRSSMIFNKDANTVRRLTDAYKTEDYLMPALADNLRKGLLLFHRPEDMCLQYGYRVGGIVDRYTAAALVLGLAIALSRIWHPVYLAVFLGVALNWVMGAIIATPAPYYSRLAGMAFIMFAVPSLWGREIVQNARESAGNWGTTVASVLLGAALVWVGYVNFRLYFVDYDAEQAVSGEAYRACLALDARDDGPQNITYVFKRAFPTNFRHRTHMFVSRDRTLKSFQKVDDIEVPEARFNRLTIVIPHHNKWLHNEVRKRFPIGDLEERKMAFREPEIIYDRYVVPLDTFGGPRMGVSLPAPRKRREGYEVREPEHGTERMRCSLPPLPITGATRHPARSCPENAHGEHAAPGGAGRPRKPTSTVVPALAARRDHSVRSVGMHSSLRCPMRCASWPNWLATKTSGAGFRSLPLFTS
jgi:4-amino-4-deoxy-L-arabinose transferase-like glycosyltransferase